jgi:DNA-binding GntR family transcriptional regulator
VRVPVNPNAAEWPYQQVAAQLREQIASGALGPRLPSAMDLAEQMGVAPNTVQRAVKVLREEGLVYSVPGRGTFVAASDSQLSAHSYS